tara:strand:- start:8092 stop:8328 length:237 start_codon:yes stop_codon:yes gene_type:complete
MSGRRVHNNEYVHLKEFFFQGTEFSNTELLESMVYLTESLLHNNELIAYMRQLVKQNKHGRTDNVYVANEIGCPASTF